MTLARAVARERARLAGVIAAGGIARAVAAGLAVLAIAALALDGGRWLALPAAPLAAWGAALAMLALAAWRTLRGLRRVAGRSEVARAVERERGLRAGALRAAEESATDGALGRLAVSAMQERVAEMGRVLAPATLARARGSFARHVIVALIALAGAVLAARSAPDGWRAVRHPARAYAGTLLPAIAMLRVPAGALRGDTVRIGLSAPGRRVITLSMRATGAPWSAVCVPLRDGIASPLLGPLDADLTLVASDGRASSDTVVIRVHDRAFLGDVAIEARFPRYLARPPEPLPAGEPMRVPQGTVLQLEARASTELAAVGLVRDGSRDTLRLAALGRRARGRVGTLGSGAWRWFARSATGAITDVPPPLEIEVVPDAAPRAEILAPAADTVLAPESRVLLRLAASDDHGVATVMLRSWRAADGRAGPTAEQLLARPGAAAWAAETPVDLAPHALAPGDALHVVVVVTDDSPWAQTAESRELVLRVPTLAEARALARALSDSTAARTADAAAAERDLARRTREAARTRSDRGAETTADRAAAERAGRGAMTYETAERAAALAKAQEQLAARVRDAERDAEALERALRAAGALDSSLARQMQEAQRMLREALTPEMARQLAAVMNASKKLSPEETRRALEQLAAQQERLRAELERTAAMLRRAALEGAMQTLGDDARELAARAHAVADSLERPDPPSREGATAVSDRARSLAEQIAALGDRLQREEATEAAREMPAAADHARRGSEAMGRAAASAPPNSASEARRGASELADVARRLGEARDAQVSAWKSELSAELDRASAEAMALSQAEQELSRRAADGPEADSGLRGDQSAVQQGVDRLSSRLERAAGRSAHVSPGAQRSLAEARARVAEATRELAESPRDGRDAAPELQTASQALSAAAAQMMRDRARVAGARSASGFAEMMQRMAELAKQQGGLNADASGLLPVPGAAPGAQAMEQARALARRQRELARALESAGDGDARAAQMAREMRDVADALDRGRIDPALLERQQRLFHRLLDAGLAMEKEEREDTGRRESRSAEEGEGLRPASGVATGRAASAFGAPGWDELRTLTAEERDAVLDYFHRLNGATPP